MCILLGSTCTYIYFQYLISINKRQIFLLFKVKFKVYQLPCNLAQIVIQILLAVKSGHTYPISVYILFLKNFIYYLSSLIAPCKFASARLNTDTFLEVYTVCQTRCTTSLHFKFKIYLGYNLHRFAVCLFITANIYIWYSMRYIELGHKRSTVTLTMLNSFDTWWTTNASHKWAYLCPRVTVFAQPKIAHLQSGFSDNVCHIKVRKNNTWMGVKLTASKMYPPGILW